MLGSPFQLQLISLHFSRLSIGDCEVCLWGITNFLDCIVCQRRPPLASHWSGSLIAWVSVPNMLRSCGSKMLEQFDGCQTMGVGMHSTEVPEWIKLHCEWRLFVLLVNFKCFYWGGYHILGFQNSQKYFVLISILILGILLDEVFSCSSQVSSLPMQLAPEVSLLIYWRL